MRVWECKIQVVDFDKSTFTMTDERNKTLLHQTKLSINSISFGYIGAQSDLTQVTTLNKKIWKLNRWGYIGHKDRTVVNYGELWIVTDSFAEQCM